MNIELIKDQVALVYLTIETDTDFEVYGGTARGAFGVCQTGPSQWLLSVSEAQAAAAAMRPFNVFARELATGREWRILDGAIVVAPRTANAPGEKISPVEYRITVPVVAGELEIPGIGIAAGIPGPQGPKGDPGPPGEGGMTEEERSLLNGAAQRGGDNTFTASNTFTGEVDMSTAQVTPPSGWNVEGVTAEQVQAVVPMAWDETSVVLGEGANYTGANSLAFGAGATTTGNGTIAIGAGATSKYNSIYGNGIAVGNSAEANLGGAAFGHRAKAGHAYATAVGNYAAAAYEGSAFGMSSSSAVGATAVGNSARAESNYSIAIGDFSAAKKAYSTVIGAYATTKADCALMIGAKFSETVDGTTVTHTCTTEGTGSITIGAGANTLNTTASDGTVTESSNSITIGCKASNSGADSVVIGAMASASAPNSVLIGAGSTTTGPRSIVIGAGQNVNFASSVCIGYSVTTRNTGGIALGNNCTVDFGSVSIGGAATSKLCGIAMGHNAKSGANKTTAIGFKAIAEDEGAVVFSSWDDAGLTKTQLYFSGANTPLANEYYNGEAFMGYTVTDIQTNQVLACGTRRLSELFPDNSLTQPASLDENGEWVMPTVFHPSDLDLPQEEPQEPEEYQPLPVWPIVEPEVPEEFANGKE